MKAASGFSFLEVLISLAIFSFGLLTLLQLQTVSLQQAYSAILRSQAENQLINLAEQLRITTQPDMIAWNNTNKLLLPEGEGTFQVQGEQYTCTLNWRSEGRKQQLSLTL